MQIATPGVAALEEFIPADRMVEVEAPPPELAIDKQAFFDQVTYAARTFNSNRDYLYAVAFIESGVRNIKAHNSEAFGPFQFMPTTWNGLVKTHGMATAITEADITFPGAQAVFAAISASDAVDEIAKDLNRIPQTRELYLTHLFGTGAGKAVLVAEQAQLIDVALRAYYKPTLGTAFVDKILSANAGLLKSDNRVRTTAEVLDKVAERLAEGLQEAATLTPHSTDAPGGQDNPPWLVPAVAELAKNIREQVPSNKEIEKYFTATTYPQSEVSDQVAWCAAFVSWCMAHSDNPKVVNANIRSAGCKDWLRWGYSTGRPAIGAVALTGRLVDGTPGHMGFVHHVNELTIGLLAGNQTNALSIVDMKKTEVIEYRWLDWKVT